MFYLKVVLLPIGAFAIGWSIVDDARNLLGYPKTAPWPIQLLSLVAIIAMVIVLMQKALRY